MARLKLQRYGAEDTRVIIRQQLGERWKLVKIDAEKVALGRRGRWYLEDEKLLKMTGEMGLECGEINMILKLDQYTGNRGVRCYDRTNVKRLLEELTTKKRLELRLKIQRNGAENTRVKGNHRQKNDGKG